MVGSSRTHEPLWGTVSLTAASSLQKMSQNWAMPLMSKVVACGPAIYLGWEQVGS